MKIKEFLKEWQNAIIVVMMFVFFLNQCSTNSTIDKQRKDKLALTSKVDSLGLVIQSYKPITSKELRIEGLKSEKRMIQATDRKILDVNRQTEIEKEIESLQSK